MSQGSLPSSGDQPAQEGSQNQIPIPAGATSSSTGTEVVTTEPVVVAAAPQVVNDFSIQVATENGSGSQSSNNILLRALFQMGIPVSGKNLFPSNIQGEPTWFTIRVSKDGWIARRNSVEILVAMNAATAVEDVKSVAPGAVVISPSNLGLDKVRADVVHYQVPFAQLAQEAAPNPKLRKLLTNMVYVGVVAELLAVDFVEVEKAVKRQLKGKSFDSNMLALNKGRDYVKANFKKSDPYVVARMNANEGKIVVDGNTATAIGCMFGGVTVMTWYPITPATSIGDAVTSYLKKYRVNKAGEPTFGIVQAEDELAALGMAMGAGWAGARSMTCTSGPGISLMAEFVGLGYFAEIPAVIFDVQRVGPSTGMPTRTAQSDLMKVWQLSHGDTRHIVLLPGTVSECYSMAVDAFDLAERFQTPVFVLSDLDLGMNLWMSDPFDYPEKPMDRGKVLTADDLTRLKGVWGRYKDVDGDGIPYRTLPGTKHTAAGYFTRGSGHNESAGYSERPGDYVANMDRLSRKYETAKQYVPKPELRTKDGAKVGVIAFGSTHHAMLESLEQLNAASTPASYLRLKALPFTDELKAFIESHDRVYVVEQNRDGQMKDIITLTLPALAHKLRSVRHYGGWPIDAQFITDAIVNQERSQK